LTPNEISKFRDDQKKWLSVDTVAESLVHCVQQCYGYRFCYSVRWQVNEKTFSTVAKPKRCRLYLHASENCPQRNLIAVKKIGSEVETMKKNQTLLTEVVFVQCLRCEQKKRK